MANFTVYGVPATLRKLAQGYDVIIPNDDTGKRIAKLFKIHHKDWIVQEEAMGGGVTAIRLYDPATRKYNWSSSEAQTVYHERISEFFALGWVER